MSHKIEESNDIVSQEPKP